MMTHLVYELQVYVYDDSVGGCCEEKRLFTEKFPPDAEKELTGDLDSAYLPYNFGTISKPYFIKGDDVWQDEGNNPTRQVYKGKLNDIWNITCSVN